MGTRLWEQGNETVDCIQTKNLLKPEQVSASYKGPRFFNYIFTSKCDVFIRYYSAGGIFPYAVFNILEIL